MRGRAVFFDRDGVVNKVIVRDGKPYSPRTIEEFILNDGIREAAYHLRTRGFRVFVVSNQPDIARGKLSNDVLDLMIRRMRWEIPIDDVYICPHDEVHQCSCRKPKPGMLMELASRWNIDLLSSFMIGDTWKDIEAGKAAGCRTILLDAPYNQNTDCEYRVRSLSEAVNLIIKSFSL